MVKSFQVNYSNNGKRLGIKTENAGTKNDNIYFIEDVRDIINSANLTRTITTATDQVASAYGLKKGIEDYCGVSLFNPIPQHDKVESNSIYIDDDTQHIIIPCSVDRTIKFKIMRGTTLKKTGAMHFLINGVDYVSTIENGIASKKINIGAILTDRYKTEGSEEKIGVGYSNCFEVSVYGEYTETESTISGTNFIIESFPYVKGDAEMPNGSDGEGHQILGCRNKNGIFQKTVEKGGVLSVPILERPGKLWKGAENAVTFYINGNFYTKNTDSNGYANITINLNSGFYYVKVFRGGTMFPIGDVMLNVTE